MGSPISSTRSPFRVRGFTPPCKRRLARDHARAGDERGDTRPVPVKPVIFITLLCRKRLLGPNSNKEPYIASLERQREFLPAPTAESKAGGHAVHAVSGSRSSA